MNWRVILSIQSRILGDLSYFHHQGIMITGSFPDDVGKKITKIWTSLKLVRMVPKKMLNYFFPELMTRKIVANSICRNLRSLLSLQGRKIAFNIFTIFV
jgi:hypothetical protein